MLDVSSALCFGVSFVKIILEWFYTLCKQISVFSGDRTYAQSNRHTERWVVSVCLRLSGSAKIFHHLRTVDDPPQFGCIGHAGPFTTVSLQNELNVRYFRNKRKGRYDRACNFKRYVSSIERTPEKGSERRRVPLNGNLRCIVLFQYQKEEFFFLKKWKCISYVIISSKIRPLRYYIYYTKLCSKISLFAIKHIKLA